MVELHPSGLTEPEVQAEADRLTPIVSAYTYRPPDQLRRSLVALLRGTS